MRFKFSIRVAALAVATLFVVGIVLSANSEQASASGVDAGGSAASIDLQSHCGNCEPNIQLPEVEFCAPTCVACAWLVGSMEPASVAKVALPTSVPVDTPTNRRAARPEPHPPKVIS